MTKRIYILGFAMLLSVASAFAQGGTTGPLTWQLTGTPPNYTLTISGVGEMPDYEYGGAPWWNYQKSITTVVIGNGVTTIGRYAFFSCTALASVVLPNSVTTIGSVAFYGCTALESVVLPNSVTTIENSAFSNCTALESITVESGNPNYSSTDGVLFNKDKTVIVCYPAGKKESSYLIPNGVTTIGDHAFSTCRALESITIPNSVTKIRPNVFIGCTALTSITVLNLVPIDIGHEVFYGWGGQGIDSVDIATITLKVPTSAVSSYQTAEVWKEMIIEGGGILVNPVTNNPEQGYTTGDGLYGGRATATVTAVPRNGYRFVNWTIDGAVISTANPYSFTVTEDVELVANFNESVGIVETGRAPSLQVYPNPTKDELRIENGELKINNVEIYDIYGKKQFSTFNFQFSTINVSHFPTGIYFIKIETDKGIVTKKFIKN